MIMHNINLQCHVSEKTHGSFARKKKIILGGTCPSRSDANESELQTM